jgi:hypothetical protein
MPLNRVVALATPLFAAAAGWVATWLAENVPGVSIDQSALEEIFIAGALIALAPAAQWLHGWQKWEARKAETQQALEIAGAAPPTLIAVEAGGDGGFFEESGGDGGLFDESGEFDELDELDALGDLDDFDEELLAEEPAPAGG